MALRLRRGTDAERQIITPLQGELVYATDTKKLYVGDGSTAGGVLVGPTAADQFTELVGDTTPQLGGDLDLNNNNITGIGNINIDGTINATGNIGLGDDASDIINVNGVINSSLKPAIDGGYDLGTGLRRWNTLHAEGAEITGQLSADSIAVTNIIGSDSTVIYNNLSNVLTVGTVNATDITGALTGNVTGNVTGNITSLGVSNLGTATIGTVTITGGSIDGVAIGQDNLIPRQDISANRIESFTGFVGNIEGDLLGNVRGQVTGDLTGSVFSDDSSVIIDGINQNVTANLARINEITSRDGTGFSDNTTRLAFNDTEQERITFEGITDGTFNRLSVVPFRAYKGTDLDNKTDTTAGDVLGGFAIDGYRTTGYVNAVNALAAWKSDADFNEGFPGASLTYFVGSNNSTFPTQFIMDGGLGTFTAPVLKSGSYATGDIPTGADVGPGSIVFDSTTNEFKGWNGTSWVVLG